MYKSQFTNLRCQSRVPRFIQTTLSDSIRFQIRLQQPFSKLFSFRFNFYLYLFKGKLTGELNENFSRILSSKIVDDFCLQARPTHTSMVVDKRSENIFVSFFSNLSQLISQSTWEKYLRKTKTKHQVVKNIFKKASW